MRFWQRASHIGRFLLRPNTSGGDSQPYTISANVNLVIVPVTVTGHEITSFQDSMPRSFVFMKKDARRCSSC
jgi:hypothetical protein